MGLSREAAACFQDLRKPELIEHSVEQLLAQRIHALALGYEDLNGHNRLRKDTLLSMCAGKAGLKPCASAPTLNRLERSASRPNRRYHKIDPQAQRSEALLTKLAVRTLRRKQRQVIIDLDATDDPLHGKQEGRFFHGYYDCHCYLPLFAFIGETIAWAQLRTSNIDGSEGSVEMLEKLVPAIRKRCPKAHIIIRADSGFCREEILSWCETHNTGYILGLARNPRLLAQLRPAMDTAHQKSILIGAGARVYHEFEYKTLGSWSRKRRVIGKAERLSDKDNPRFIVTTLEGPADKLYEEVYCARGEMENHIKEHQTDLFGEKLSCAGFAANQLRLWLCALAYTLMERLRAVALKGGELTRATMQSIRLKVLKLAARVETSVRRIRVRLADASATMAVFAHAHERLRRLRV